tara:strand:- start:184 stop:699 length:516 start_codon:yes stop_codon:yes gene_type:complete
MAHEVRTRNCQRDVYFQKASNQSSVQYTGNSYIECHQSVATYTPTAGATYVVVEYTTMTSEQTNYNNAYFKLQLSSDGGSSYSNVGDGYTVATGQVNDDDGYGGILQLTFRYMVPTSTWSGERTTRIRGFSVSEDWGQSGNTYRSQLHHFDHYLNNQSMKYYNPSLKIYSI